MCSMGTPLSLFCLPFLFLPPVFLQKEENWWILELFIAANNALLAACAPIITVSFIIVFEQLRRKLFPKRFQTGEQFWLPFSPRFDRIHGNEPIYYCLVAFELVIFRATTYISLIILMAGIVIERLEVLMFCSKMLISRALATKFVVDYEKKKRTWISICILAVNFSASIMISSEIIRVVINGVFFGIFLLLPVFVSIIIFRILLKKNELRLGRLNDLLAQQKLKDGYSLSLRMQLRENIWTMKKLYRLSLAAVPLCFCCLPFLALPSFLLRDESQWWLLELIIEVSNKISNDCTNYSIAPIFTLLACNVFEQVRMQILP
ncbi:hypothetical protein PMAYCL1PPCAC_09804, partial [Pristionchus mayeri]